MGSESSAVTSSSVAPDADVVASQRKKKLVKVRKDRDGQSAGAPLDAPRVMTSFTATATAAGALYLVFLSLRLALVFSPGVIENTESMDGADFMAAKLLPGMSASASPVLPDGMQLKGVIPKDASLNVLSKNYTRSIVGAFVTSGIPYAAVNVACNHLPLFGSLLCAPERIGYTATYVPRLWMFLLSLLGDMMLVNVFAVYNSEFAVPALLAYSSSWMAMLAMTRNSNFVLEALCLLGLLSSCFGWTYESPRPVFWISGTALALGVFLRPVFGVFVCTPLIYLVSLWGKKGVDPFHYARAALEGLAVFGFWASIWVSVDSVFYGAFSLRFGDVKMETFEMFVDTLLSGAGRGPFNYKGFLVYVPLNGCTGLFTKAFWVKILQNTSPGQMFIQLPVVLGPLMVLLIRESIDGMKLAIKELMGEFKTATGGKKKRRARKSGMSKEREEEMLVYYDTIQTTLLLGLLLEVMQSHDRIGIMSLLALNGPAIICIAPFVFGELSSRNARLAHFAYTAAMVLFYGIMHQSGVLRTLLSVGSGGVNSIQKGTDLVIYHGHVHHPSSALGANLKDIRVHNGGEDRLALMSTLRALKEKDGYDESRLLVCAPGTLDMKDVEFELLDRVSYGHLSLEHLPDNIDAAFTGARLHLYKFIGDEDEAILRDKEEAEEEEEAENEERQRQKKKRSRR